MGATQKAFLDMRAMFDRDVKATLAEVDRGEHHLRSEVRKAMRDDALSADARAFLGVALDRLVSGEQRIEASWTNCGMGQIRTTESGGGCIDCTLVGFLVISELHSRVEGAEEHGRRQTPIYEG